MRCTLVAQHIERCVTHVAAHHIVLVSIRETAQLEPSAHAGHLLVVTFARPIAIANQVRKCLCGLHHLFVGVVPAALDVRQLRPSPLHDHAQQGDD